ncbi:hypothetical protein P0W64_11695 [Tsukamurella sp. 8F]|uniref:hypothetical protein n=1 Tax=Tsukamurella sp. 8F TaxID=3031961 RepID=UPI0023B88D05|nr:hypothetical protein [Tsukamurella sp. 8F]MDF0587435.1 hypothetical protein [Tsukamurella sp. 8F]
MSIRHTAADTSLGPLTIMASSRALVGPHFRHHRRRPDSATFSDAIDTDRLHREAILEIVTYLADERRRFDLPASPDGDFFRWAVRAVVGEVACGETITNGESAEYLDQVRMAWQTGRWVRTRCARRGLRGRCYSSGSTLRASGR